MPTSHCQLFLVQPSFFNCFILRLIRRKYLYFLQKISHLLQRRQCSQKIVLKEFEISFPSQKYSFCTSNLIFPLISCGLMKQSFKKCIFFKFRYESLYIKLKVDYRHNRNFKLAVLTKPIYDSC